MTVQLPVTFQIHDVKISVDQLVDVLLLLDASNVSLVVKNEETGKIELVNDLMGIYMSIKKWESSQ